MAATKKCSECLAEIPKAAKKCQYCSSKQKNGVGFIGGFFIVLLAIVLIPLIISSFTGSSSSLDKQKIAETRKANTDARNKLAKEEFLSGRNTVLEKIKGMVSDGNFSGASYQAKRYINAGIKDDELTKIYSESNAEISRIAKLNNTGIWKNSYYVDDFGEPTNDPYIINKDLIKGSFSNSATQDSKLNVNFLITKKAKISFQLYEYARKNPVKSYGESINYSYTVLVKDKDGKKYKLSAKNWSERLTFGPSHSKRVHDILMKGGKVSFNVVDNQTRSNQYYFVINNANWYDNAYRKLKEAYKKRK